jgi:putative aldouronate transport system substrate-binding protein
MKVNGQIQYGSINTNAKKVLAHLHTLYQEGILDQKFLQRTSANITQEIINEKCGAFFGPWWVPNNPLVDAIKKNPHAKWTPYRIATSSDGTTSYHSINPTTKFVVVRKGYKHPEVIFKIISVIFDYLRYENKNVRSINRYYALNVDPTARPIAINVDYANALNRSYASITKILKGGKITDDISSSDVSYASACRDYLKNAKNNRAENWAAYTTRIEALKLLDTEKIKKVQCVFFGTTKTYEKKGYYLEQLEEDTYLKIISGKAKVSSFDDFVKKWKKNGGDAITKEVIQYEKSKS